MKPRAITAWTLLLVAAPSFAHEPPSAYLERQHPAVEADAKVADKNPVKESCRVQKEWKVGETVVQHRVCGDPPKPQLADRKRAPPQR